MFDMPEHQMMPVDENGDGPVHDNDAVAYRCWCGTDCGTLQHVYNTEGGTLCADMKREGVAMPDLISVPRPGFCPPCLAYTIWTFQMLRDGREP